MFFTNLFDSNVWDIVIIEHLNHVLILIFLQSVRHSCLNSSLTVVILAEEAVYGRYWTNDFAANHVINVDFGTSHLMLVHDDVHFVTG